MEPPQWQEIARLFSSALELEGANREAYLDTACAGRGALRVEVEAMLASHDESGRLAIERRLLRDDPADTDAEDPALGMRLPPYRIRSLLGRGGMGTVYLAERDDAQYRQVVALKLLRPEVHFGDAASRFRMERQILARLQHANIARLLDGGVTPDGRPYLVMEYVAGSPITTFSDDQSLSLRERLQLFLVVCRAVQFAHQNLVVHRDLKPTNIIVTREGEVRLLDFGIAKLLDPEISEDAVAHTRADVRVMTPEYAAPEQVRGGAITTATDVYALGVLLYELLAGRRPYDLNAQSRAEAERIICERTPPRPSERIESDGDIGGDFSEADHAGFVRIATARSTTTHRLRRTLRGDLDNVVMKALAKEPERRYASVEQLADDIHRYLAGQTVVARKDSVGYRLGKFVRRHRLGVGTAAAFLLVVSGFSGVTLWQAGRLADERDLARDERDRAEQAQLQAEAVSDYLMQLFAANDPDESRGETITAAELLERGVARVEGLEGQPSVQARMVGVMGQIYRKLGRFEESEGLLQRAVSQWRDLDDPRELARSLNHLGVLYLDRGRVEEGESALREGYALRVASGAPPDLDLAESLHNLGGLARERGNVTAADSLFRAAIAIRADLLGADHPLTTRTMRLRAGGLDRLGAFTEAEEILRDVLALQRRHFGEVHPEVALTLNDLALLLKRQGRLETSAEFYRQTIEMRRTLYGDAHPRVGIALVNYGKLLTEADAFDDATAPFTEAIAIFREAHGPHHPDVAWALEAHARSHAAGGDHERALPWLREALSVQQRVLDSSHPRIAATMVSLAISLSYLTRFREAEELFHSSLSIYQQAYGDDHADAAIVHGHLGRMYQAERRFEEAERHLGRAVSTLRRRLPPGHLRTAAAAFNLGRLYMDRSAPEAAEPLLREALEMRRAALPADNPLVAEAEELLAACLRARVPTSVVASDG